MAGPGITTKKRLIFMLISFTVVITALLGRVAWIQFISDEWLQQKAYAQQTKSRIINPKRGTIYDRNGKELAVSASVEMVAVSPMDIIDSVDNNKEALEKRRDEIANMLSETLGMEKENVMKKITANSRYEIVQRKMPKDQGDKIRKWISDNEIEGIYIDEDTMRFYPNKNLAAHVLGFTDIDNKGQAGIEYSMDKYLQGVPGRILGEVDAGGRDVPFMEERRIDAQEGLNVVLTIDETIQHLAEKAIEKAIDDNKVLNGAFAIVLDPRNGEVLAMVSKPDFDPNDPRGTAPPGVDPANWSGKTVEDVNQLNQTLWRNKAVQDTYEPGSTFKAITSAAGLEENVINSESRVNDFTVKVGGWSINCWRPNAHGEQSFREGVYNSCNPVFVTVSQSLGLNRFYKYVKAFGFFEKTGIELPGEQNSIFQEKPKEVDMAVASFGQRFTITPIQLAAAYGAIANGGQLMKPTLIREITDSQGNIVMKKEPEPVRTVISKQTSDTLKDILEGVVSEGTGRNAYVKGFRVAGKTGTSETTTANRYIASFSAFAPADNPVVTVLIALDNPQVYPHTGGMIAAPVAGKLVEDILSYLEVERRYTDMDKEMMMQEVSIPDLRGRTFEDAKEVLRNLGLEYKLEGNGESNTIVDQTPKPNVSVPQKSVVILYSNKAENQDQARVPDLMNRTIGEATRMLNDIGLNIRVEGLGTAVGQSIQAGEYISKGEVVEVSFKLLNTE